MAEDSLGGQREKDKAKTGSSTFISLPTSSFSTHPASSTSSNTKIVSKTSTITSSSSSPSSTLIFVPHNIPQAKLVLWVQQHWLNSTTHGYNQTRIVLKSSLKDLCHVREPNSNEPEILLRSPEHSRKQEPHLSSRNNIWSTSYHSVAYSMRNKV